MTPEYLKKFLEEVQQGKKTVDEALEELKTLPFKDLGHTKIDQHRELRTGYPEVIFCEGKTIDQVKSIIRNMMDRDNNILGTRANPEMFEAVKKIAPDIEYNEHARTITLHQREIEAPETYIAIVTAGTSDIPVAEEAAVTAEIFGNTVHRIFDVGVAGIHRLQGSYDEIAGARVVVVAAGMEGALPSVVGGLVPRPIIALPTSVGYGAAFNGLAALLGMLTSCASGVSVVNIDNGFGAGYLASMINKIK
jgi:pyridinium-3,5-biscarboxylic acid mononucleotide synthase